MIKTNIKSIKCVCCGKRGDTIGNRDYINRISTPELLNKVNDFIAKEKVAALFDYLCQACK